jgi:hypothetical protein
MLRSLGLNVPQHDDRIFDPDFAYLGDGGTSCVDPEPTVMDAAGWGDTMGVDDFINEMEVDALIDYAIGMGYDFDA